MSEDAKRASTETLRNAATAAPGEKVASLESADGAESVRAYDEDEIAHTVPLPRRGGGRDVYVLSRTDLGRLDRSWDRQIQKMLMDVLIIPVF